jgi:lipopolysaccharide biosynthesis protein
MTAHKHTFDIHPKFPTRISCTICGFSAPAVVLKSKVNLDAWTARQNATQSVLDLLGIDRDGNEVAR